MRRSPSRNLQFRSRSRAKSSKEDEYSEVWFAELDCPAVEPGFPLRGWIEFYVVVRLCLSWENVVISLMEADCFRYGAVARTWPSEVIPVRLGNKFPRSGWLQLGGLCSLSAVEPGFPLRGWIEIYVVVRLRLSWENVVLSLMEADCFRYDAVARTWPSEVIPVRLTEFAQGDWSW